MAVSPSTNAMTTVTAARSHMGKEADVTPKTTDKLQRLINAYSRAIATYTGRQFKPLETGIAKKFRYDGSGYQSLAPFELAVCTSVVLYSDLPTASWVTLNPQSATVASDYRLEPRNGTAEHTYLTLSLPELGQYSALVPEPLVTRRPVGFEVTVTGDWGAGVVPDDVEFACLVAVANAYRNPEGFASRSLGAMTFTDGAELPGADTSGFSLPRDSRALLSPYRRTAFG